MSKNPRVLIQRLSNLLEDLRAVEPGKSYEMSTEHGVWIASIEKDGDDAYRVTYRPNCDPFSFTVHPLDCRAATFAHLWQFAATFARYCDIIIELEDEDC